MADFRSRPVILTFDLSASKIVAVSGDISVMDYFLPIFSFLRPSIVDLVSGSGQTDGQTTAIDVICPTLCRRGIIKINITIATRETIYKVSGALSADSTCISRISFVFMVTSAHWLNVALDPRWKILLLCRYRRSAVDNEKALRGDANTARWL